MKKYVFVGTDRNDPHLPTIYFIEAENEQEVANKAFKMIGFSEEEQEEIESGEHDALSYTVKEVDFSKN